MRDSGQIFYECMGWKFFDKMKVLKIWIEECYMILMSGVECQLKVSSL